FIQYIRQLKERQSDLASAKIIGENENVVRIMSIHKSKGLEFPVVFLSGVGSRFNLGDLNGNMLLHAKYGFGAELIDADLRITCTTAAKEAIKTVLRAESLSEEMRVLYVALTRAKEKLIITAVVNDAQKQAVKWANYRMAADGALEPMDMLSVSCMLDWLGGAVIRHPNGRVLRELSNLDSLNIVQDNSEWQVQVVDASTLTTIGETKDIALTEQPDATPDAQVQKTIFERLSWQYPYSEITKLPVKISVSELKRLHESPDEQADYLYRPKRMQTPAFLQPTKGLTAAEKGSVVHFVMQHVDLKQEISLASISHQINGMVQNDLLTVEQAKAVKAESIVRFYTSELGERILKAKKVLRELPFHIPLKCHEVYPQLPPNEDETIMLQGMIDCCFIEGDGWTLVDYKTDRIEKEGVQAIADRYKIQMHYYAEALTRLTHLPVHTRILYFFDGACMVNM
ncbi:MAG: PD-(D/E)XK nuclease family protein, partial [Hyphomonadaceae bacterium]|nr:PD-(D/E)XK nuclease family protein [Clostridia bacterium]